MTRIVRIEDIDSDKTDRMTAEQERELACDIRRHEHHARALLDGLHPDIDTILRRRPKREEKTKAGSVDRLEEALELAQKLVKEHPELAEDVCQARLAWDNSERLRWWLANSCARVARGEARKLAGPFLDEEELVQEGFIGLLRAAKRFDPDRGVRFSTYSRWWVRAQMTRAIDHTGRPVRLPGCAVEQTRNLRKAMKRFETMGSDYTLADLAQEVGIGTDRAELLLSQGMTVSLEQPVDDGPRPRSLDSFLADHDAANPEEEAINGAYLGLIKKLFDAVLDTREILVLTERYGLEGNEPRTLSDIGKEMKLSRERVRQIEAKALDRLRAAAEAGAEKPKRNKRAGKPKPSPRPPRSRLVDPKVLGHLRQQAKRSERENRRRLAHLRASL